VRLFQIDSFTDRPFAGNPAGVVLLDEPRDAVWMQAVAAEMNVAETAFLESRDDPGCYGLRWFTPTVEVDLCGHATLASAHALWQAGEDPTRLRFATRSGELTAEKVDAGIQLDFPAVPATEVDDERASRVVAAVGCSPVWIGRSRFDYLIEVADEQAVRQVRPDFLALRPLHNRGVIVTARADPAPGNQGDSVDIVSRFFAPAVGIDEDPVTGSAHCCLGPYWAERLGRETLVGYQASVRGGHVGMALTGDRVLLTGAAVTVIRGEID
jgi:predicted PhzF superfamily epimerase YddE/YHI9